MVIGLLTTQNISGDESARPISLSLPLSPYPYQSKILFSFFDGLIPEGYPLNCETEYFKYQSIT
ncbi:HipA N-terminal domain-containing protein [Pedobacter vanadiisoli]|uniref:HipA N-terminal domain-containing protein n=1 Tax=Pedobacter vanadiisoli TaxID=1761975 RepID=A0ABW5MRE9_9SPHI